jgi:hypothetical protein
MCFNGPGRRGQIAHFCTPIDADRNGLERWSPLIRRRRVEGFFMRSRQETKTGRTMQPVVKF